MRLINERHLRQMEELLGRSLTPEELQPAERLSAVSRRVQHVARLLLRRSRPLAVMYLQELVPKTEMNDVNSFLDRVIEGEVEAALWEQSRLPESGSRE